MTTDKYTAIAAECYGRMPSGIAESLERSAIARIAEAIASAVEAEKAKATVEWAHEADALRSLGLPFPQTDWAKGFNAGARESYEWLRQNTKIVWGEK